METIGGWFDMGFNGIKSGFLSSYSATDHDRLERNGKDRSFVSLTVTRFAIEAMALFAHEGAVLDNG
jgi:hypothetical protein